MIEVRWDGRKLAVSGHADTDPRVCAAVSSVVTTLFVSYGASRPDSGYFEWDPSGQISNEVFEFVMNQFRALSRQYPKELQLTESECNAA